MPATPFINHEASVKVCDIILFFRPVVCRISLLLAVCIVPVSVSRRFNIVLPSNLIFLQWGVLLFTLLFRQLLLSTLIKNWWSSNDAMSTFNIELFFHWKREEPPNNFANRLFPTARACVIPCYVVRWVFALYCFFIWIRQCHYLVILRSIFHPPFLFCTHNNRREYNQIITCTQTSYCIVNNAVLLVLLALTCSQFAIAGKKSGRRNKAILMACKKHDKNQRTAHAL